MRIGSCCGIKLHVTTNMNIMLDIINCHRYFLYTPTSGCDLDPIFGSNSQTLYSYKDLTIVTDL
jgi:hypothetical protein